MEYPLILLIETATATCSVALAQGKKVVAQKETDEPFRHAELLTLFIEDLFKQAGVLYHQLNAVCVSRGPGSYTGLRIGVSVAKGICFATGASLLSVDTLYAYALRARENNPDFEFYIPMLDARRMEVYTQVVNNHKEVVLNSMAMVLNNESFSNYIHHPKALFFGDGSTKFKALQPNANAEFVNLSVSASSMADTALDLFNQRRFEDLAYFEPDYLKEFYTTAKKTI